MKIQLSKSEILFLKECLETRKLQNKKLSEKRSGFLERHANHLKLEAELSNSIFKKLEGKKCQLGRCQSELSANIKVSDFERNDILICETCAEILETKAGDKLPEYLNKLDLYYLDSKI